MWTLIIIAHTVWSSGGVGVGSVSGFKSRESCQQAASVLRTTENSHAMYMLACVSQ